MVDDPRSRRRALRLIGMIGATTVAGCIDRNKGSTATPTAESTPTGTQPDPRSTRDTDTPTVEIDDVGMVAEFPRYDDGFKTVRIGSRSGVSNEDENLPHELLIWNPAETLRQISVAIFDVAGESQTTVLNDTFEIPAGELLLVRLLEPSDYRVSIGGPNMDASVTFDVSQNRFDCNESHHEITVTTRGEIAHVVYSTALQCTSETSSAAAGTLT